MPHYVVRRQGKRFVVERVDERGKRRPVVKCASEEEAIAYRRTLQAQADAAEVLKDAMPRPRMWWIADRD